MFRINTANKEPNLFGLNKDGFRAGNPSSGQQATELSAAFMNSLQEEVAAVIEGAGFALNTANSAQMLAAIHALIEARAGDYSLDTGAANAYVIALNPAITAYAGNLSGSFKVANTNTGASTLNAGGGAVALVNDAGAALAPGDLVAGTIVAYQYSLADNKFYITVGVASQLDARYAALAGLLTQAFSAADGATGKQVVNISQFAASLAANGYQKLPSGYILQAGALVSSAVGDVSIAFPTTFPNMAQEVVLSAYDPIATAPVVASYAALTTSGFNMGAYTSNTAARTAVQVGYIAIGY